MMDRDRGIGLSGRRYIEKDRDTLLPAIYRRSSDR